MGLTALITADRYCSPDGNMHGEINYLYCERVTYSRVIIYKMRKRKRGIKKTGGEKKRRGEKRKREK